MKSLFEQFGGTYREERNYVIPNLECQIQQILKSGFMDNSIYIFYNIIVK